MTMIDITNMSDISDEQLLNLLKMATNERLRREQVERDEAFEKAEKLMAELNDICEKYDFSFSAYNYEYGMLESGFISVNDLGGR